MESGLTELKLSLATWGKKNIIIKVSEIFSIKYFLIKRAHTNRHIKNPRSAFHFTSFSQDFCFFGRYPSP